MQTYSPCIKQSSLCYSEFLLGVSCSESLTSLCSVVPRSCPVPTQRPLCPCSSKKAVLYLLVSEACGGLSQALQSAPHCGPPPPPSCEDGLAPFWPRVCFDKRMTPDSPRGKGGFHSAPVQQEYILGSRCFHVKLLYWRKAYTCWHGIIPVEQKKAWASLIVSSRWWLIYELHVLPVAIFFILGTGVLSDLISEQALFFPIC